MKNDCVYSNGGVCSVLICKQCEKNGHCTFYQTAKTRDIKRREWAEKILNLPKPKLDLYNNVYYRGRLKQYAEEVINAEN